ncbi:hypothetical protein L9F63_013236, partial [Diploptera punctata]
NFVIKLVSFFYEFPSSFLFFLYTSYCNQFDKFQIFCFNVDGWCIHYMKSETNVTAVQREVQKKRLLGPYLLYLLFYSSPEYDQFIPIVLSLFRINHRLRLVVASFYGIFHLNWQIRNVLSILFLIVLFVVDQLTKP